MKIILSLFFFFVTSNSFCFADSIIYKNKNKYFEFNRKENVLIIRINKQVDKLKTNDCVNNIFDKKLIYLLDSRQRTCDSQISQTGMIFIHKKINLKIKWCPSIHSPTSLIKSLYGCLKK